MGGHEANFNPPLEDKYKCPVCLTALKDPIQTKCGHRLCSTCFKTIRGGNWYFRCPVDNTWSNHVFEDNAVKREVLSLGIDCNNKQCSWCGELRELQSHLKLCEYEKIGCPNKCKFEIMRIELEKHLEECPLRLETCKHCNIQVVVSQLARHHVLLCPKFPVNCPVCGEAEIVRENMNSHINIINGDCPMVIVPCSFRHIGCMHQDKRSKMSKHYLDANCHHLMLLSTRLVDLETKHRLDLQVCAKKFEQNLNTLCDKYTDTEKKCLGLEKELIDSKKNISQLKNAVKELKILVHSNEFLHYHHKRLENKNSASSSASNNCLTHLTTNQMIIAANGTCTTIQGSLTSSASCQTNLASSNNASINCLPHEQVFEWNIDLSSKRKAYYSPSYCLINSSYKIHLWLKPEISIDKDFYSTVCVILERCDNEEELPVSFDCCFFLNDCKTSKSSDLNTLFPKQSKSFVTTDPFHMSGHVSKPMILYKTNDFYSFSNENKLNIEFTIRAIKESE